MLKEREIIRLLHQGISQCEYFTHFSEILTIIVYDGWRELHCSLRETVHTDRLHNYLSFEYSSLMEVPSNNIL